MSSGVINYPGTLRDVLETVAYARSSDDTRYNLGAIKLEREGDDLLAIATDGHRLHCARAVGFDFPLPEGGLMLSPKAVKEIQKLLHRKGGHVAQSMEVVEIDSGGIRLDCRGLQLTIRPEGDDGTPYGEFPNWRQVVPADPKHDPPKLGGGVSSQVGEAFSALGAIGSPAFVDFEVSDCKLKLTREADLPGGTIKGEAEFPIQGDGPKGEAIRVNGSYMADAFSHLGGEVSVYVADDRSPILLRNCESFAVVMPVRRS